MDPHKNQAKTIGTFFVIATVAAIAGLLFYTPILHNPNYIIDGTSNQKVAWGAFFEIVTAFAVIGTSVAFYPTLKEYDGRMALATVAFRVAEATVIVIGILCLLTIVTLNIQLGAGADADLQVYAVIGKMLVAFHNWTFLFGPNVLLGPSTLLTAYILYKTNLVPKSVSIIGLIGGPAIFACGVLVTLDVFEQLSVWGILLTFPVFFYEMYLASYLIIKGFKREEVKAEPIHPAPLHNLYKLAEEKNDQQELIHMRLNGSMNILNSEKKIRNIWWVVIFFLILSGLLVPLIIIADRYTLTIELWHQVLIIGIASVICQLLSRNPLHDQPSSFQKQLSRNPFAIKT